HVAVQEGDVSRTVHFPPRVNAVGSAAATQVQNAVAFLYFHDFDKRPGAVVEPAIGKDAGPGDEVERWPFINANVKCHFMPAARPVAFAMAIEQAAAGGSGRVDSAKNLLESGREERIALERRQDGEHPA